MHNETGAPAAPRAVFRPVRDALAPTVQDSQRQALVFAGKTVDQVIDHGPSTLRPGERLYGLHFTDHTVTTAYSDEIDGEPPLLASSHDWCTRPRCRGSRQREDLVVTAHGRMATLPVPLAQLAQGERYVGEREPGDEHPPIIMVTRVADARRWVFVRRLDADQDALRDDGTPECTGFVTNADNVMVLKILWCVDGVHDSQDRCRACQTHIADPHEPFCALDEDPVVPL